QLLKGNVRFEAIVKVLEEYLPLLNGFIEHKATKLSRKTAMNPGEHESYRTVQKKLRYLSLYLLKQLPPDEFRETSYKYQKYCQRGNEGQEEGLGSDRPYTYFRHVTCLFANEQSRFALYRMMSAIHNFRRQACIKLFPQKIQALIGDQNPEKLSLLQLSWLHGTRSLEAIKASNHTLIPTGWMWKLGITPMSGELREGAECNGVNNDSISGTGLTDVQVAINYAKSYTFHPEEEANKIEKFFTWKLNSLLDLNLSSALPNANAAIRKLARWDQPLFKAKYLEKCKAQVARLQTAVQQIEAKKPKELFDYHSDYYTGPWMSIKNSLESLSQFLFSPLPQPLSAQEKVNLLSAYPVVCGSSTLPVKLASNVGEQAVFGPAQLGEDVQALFTPAEYKQRIQGFLASGKLLGQVSVHTFDELEQLQVAEKKARPFLVNIFSIRKMCALFASL
ncbi:MAG TPA: hypothetical protein VN457_00720, partial [Chlamydiales bacterium]|nr:hypothetical protein [Chlamydiales bacterium]